MTKDDSMMERSTNRSVLFQIRDEVWLITLCNNECIINNRDVQVDETDTASHKLQCFLSRVTLAIVLFWKHLRKVKRNKLEELWWNCCSTKFSIFCILSSTPIQSCSSINEFALFVLSLILLYSLIGSCFSQFDHYL